MTPIAIALIVMTTALIIGVGLIAYGSATKNDWGINLDAVVCPKCSTPLRYTRIPTSRRQALWGGYTCPNCACETDKWGREIADDGIRLR
jgi:hypothetical protein